MEDDAKPKRVYVEKFRDGRPPIQHNHPFTRIPGKRPRPPGPLKRLIPRTEWKGKAPEYGDNLKKLTLPVTQVRYFDTNSDICINFKDCSDFLQDLQWEEMKNGFPDIKYNFYVASDGAVYEGRGWNHVSEHSAEENKVPWTKNIDIAFIGAYLNRRLPKNMTTAALDLIDWGVYHHKVNCCHEILPLKTNVKKRVYRKKQKKDVSNDEEGVSENEERVSKNSQNLSKDEEDESKDEEDLLADEEDESKNEEDVSSDEQDISKDEEDMLGGEEDESKDDEEVSTDEEDVSKEDEVISKDEGDVSKDEEDVSQDEEVISQDESHV